MLCMHQQLHLTKGSSAMSFMALWLTLHMTDCMIDCMIDVMTHEYHMTDLIHLTLASQ